MRMRELLLFVFFEGGVERKRRESKLVLGLGTVCCRCPGVHISQSVCHNLSQNFVDAERDERENLVKSPKKKIV